MHFSHNIVACLVSGGELARLFMCTLLVTQNVASLVSASELASFSICMFLVTQTVACLVSVCELACFNVHSSGHRCGLSVLVGEVAWFLM